MQGERRAEVAIIGGTGVYGLLDLEEAEAMAVSTPFGIAQLQVGRWQGRSVAFLPRHGAQHQVPPHRINYRANIWALRCLGARRVLATSAVGSLRPDWPPGQLVVYDQFLDFTKGRVGTFYDGEPLQGHPGAEGGWPSVLAGSVVHTDVTSPYCPQLRRGLIEAALALRAPVQPAGCYVCTEGPRYETAAEIRAFRLLGGDVVGMTGVPEVVLAREAGLCYAGVALVTNLAAGVGRSSLSHDDVVAAMNRTLPLLVEVLRRVVAQLPAEVETGCCAGSG